MATEGQFPKIDGDVLYASETNGFRQNTRFIIGSGLITFGSATGFQQSSVYSGTILGLTGANSVLMDIELGAFYNSPAGGNDGFYTFVVDGDSEIVGGSRALSYGGANNQGWFNPRWIGSVSSGNHTFAFAVQVKDANNFINTFDGSNVQKGQMVVKVYGGSLV